MEEIKKKISKYSEYHSNDDTFSKNELNLAFRNHGIHYEALKEDITSVGMHYLLIHFDIPFLQWETYRLRVVCKDGSEVQFSMEDFLSRPKVSLPVTMECAGNGRANMKPRFKVSQPWDYNGIGTAVWGGISLKSLLMECGYGVNTNEDGDDESKKSNNPFEFLFTGKDKGIQHDEVQKYQRSLSFENAMHEDVLLAYEMNGQRLLPQHGFPLRLIVPGFYGMTNIKWLESIEPLESKFSGVQMHSYIMKYFKEEIGKPISHIVVRSVIVPPGIPDWYNRMRFVEEGEVLIEGRAWAGPLSIEKVEVGIDGVFHLATLDEPLGKYAWRRWSYVWKATEGQCILSSKATDEKGNTQKEEDQIWNYGGFCNNTIQTCVVTVKKPRDLDVGKKINLKNEVKIQQEYKKSTSTSIVSVSTMDAKIKELDES